MAHDKEAVISGKHEGNVILAPERTELPPQQNAFTIILYGNINKQRQELLRYDTKIKL